MSSFSYFVGQRIKKYRKSRGYTIEQFSAMINKSKATLSKYENGTITIDIETLYDIAQALDIDLKCFIDYQPPVFHQDAGRCRSNFYFNQPRRPICTTTTGACVSWCAPCCASPAAVDRRRHRRDRSIWAWRPSTIRITASTSSPAR